MYCSLSTCTRTCTSTVKIYSLCKDQLSGKVDCEQVFYVLVHVQAHVHIRTNM